MGFILLTAKKVSAPIRVLLPRIVISSKSVENYFSEFAGEYP
jgi:hypothetical protein